jgi:RNA recognition motif-containing protein
VTRIIHVGNLPASVDSAILKRLFETYGNVRSASIETDDKNDGRVGVGFVEMEFKESGDAAIAGIDRQNLLGRLLSACWYQSSHRQLQAHRQMFAPLNQWSRIGGEPNPR